MSTSPCSAAAASSIPQGALLRRFMPADIPAALELWKRTEGIGLNESDTPAALEAFLARNADLSFVVEREGTLVGALLCGHDGRRGYLHHLAVSRQVRRQGIGTALVEACLARLKEEGIQKCNLFLFASNHDGRKFWLRSGWGMRDDLVLVQKSLLAKPSACGC